MSRIIITGDTHRDFTRFFDKESVYSGLTKNDYVIVCGDFGAIWTGDNRDKTVIKQLGKLPFTVLFVDGNHSNFDALYDYPVEEWYGGYIHKISKNVFHLCRGQIFDIDGKKFFTFGGAASHDIKDGILNPDDPIFYLKYRTLCKNPYAQFRILGISWWKEEMPNDKEYAVGNINLEKANYEIDYIVSHCPPSSALAYFGNGAYETDKLSDYLEGVYQKTNPKAFYCGHIHINDKYDKIHILYKDFEEIM